MGVVVVPTGSHPGVLGLAVLAVAGGACGADLTIWRFDESWSSNHAFTDSSSLQNLSEDPSKCNLRFFNIHQCASFQ